MGSNPITVARRNMYNKDKLHTAMVSEKYTYRPPDFLYENAGGWNKLNKQHNEEQRRLDISPSVK